MKKPLAYVMWLDVVGGRQQCFVGRKVGLRCETGCCSHRGACVQSREGSAMPQACRYTVLLNAGSDSQWLSGVLVRSAAAGAGRESLRGCEDGRPPGGGAGPGPERRGLRTHRANPVRDEEKSVGAGSARQRCFFTAADYPAHVGLWFARAGLDHAHDLPMSPWPLAPSSITMVRTAAAVSSAVMRRGSLQHHHFCFSLSARSWRPVPSKAEMSQAV